MSNPSDFSSSVDEEQPPPSSTTSSGLDSQRITSHRDTSFDRKLEKFGQNFEKSWSEVQNEFVRYMRILREDATAKKFENCGEDFAVFECQNCNEEFSAPITCDLRICPSCRNRLRSEFIDELSSLVGEVENHRHAVFSIPNLPFDISVSDLQDKVRELKEKFGQLRRRKYFDERVQGTIYGVEVKQGENGFNLHLHVFIALKSDTLIDYRKVADMWCEYFPDANPSAQEFRKHRGSNTALVEVVSYATKGAYFESGEAMAKWCVATKGSRLIGRTGLFFDACLSREKEYVECPFCGSREVQYIGKWSELQVIDVCSEPPPTVNEIKGGENYG